MDVRTALSLHAAACATQGAKLVRLKRQVSETDERLMVDTVADQLKRTNYRIEEGPVAEGHSKLIRGPVQRE